MAEKLNGRRLGIVGLGQQGVGIAALLVAQGFELGGAVDIGDKVGRKISELVPSVSGDAIVHDSVTSLIAHGGEEMGTVVLAAAISLTSTLAQAKELMAAGVNVVTLQPDLFEVDDSWADELQRIGESTGATFLSTGVQDTWWVHMPAVAAGSTNNVRSVQVEHLIDLESLPVAMVDAMGYGVPHKEFEPHKADTEALPPILGGPLRVAAKKMGFVPTPVEFTVNPIVNQAPVLWERAGRELRAGSVIGTEEFTQFTTDAGVDFRGYLRVRLLAADESPTDLVTIDADPVIRLEHKPFPGDQVTNIAVVARIPDVVEAAGGVLSAASLGPAKYRRPAAVL